MVRMEIIEELIYVHDWLEKEVRSLHGIGFEW